MFGPLRLNWTMDHTSGGDADDPLAMRTALGRSGPYGPADDGIVESDGSAAGAMDDGLRGTARGTPLAGFVRIPRRMPKPKNHLAGLAAFTGPPAPRNYLAEFAAFTGPPAPRNHLAALSPIVVPPAPKNHLAGLATLLRRPEAPGGVAGAFESGPEPRDLPWDILLPRVEGKDLSPTPRAERQPKPEGTWAQGRDPLKRFPLAGGIYAGAFLDAIARAERNAKGYAEVNPGWAWGRYQMTRKALIDGGILDPETEEWTGPLARKLGIESVKDFLASPLAQEEAFQAYLKRTETYLRNFGALAHLGRTIHGIKGKITISEGNLLAAAHRQGAGTVARYLDHLKRHNWRSDPSTFPPGELGKKFLHIETRLRTFQGIHHRAR